MKLSKIMFIHPFLLHYHYPRLSTLAEECSKVGISLYNITLAKTTDIYRPFTDNRSTDFTNITLFPEDDLESIPSKKIWFFLNKQLDDIQPDVIFVYGYSINVLRRTKFWGEKRNVAVVLISDSNEFDRRRNQLTEFIKSLHVRQYDAAFVGGKNSRLYLQHLGISEDRIIPGYDVVDNELFFRQTYENNKDKSETRSKWNLPNYYFLFVGRLVKNKNVRGLIDAYSNYVKSIGKNASPWDLIICGSGPEENELHRHTNSLPEQVKNHILFYGLIKQPELIDFFSCASCFILPSTKYESWGLVVNEAMACDLPVIVSSRCGCSADLVKNSYNGWLFDPYKSDELTERMLRIYELDPCHLVEAGLHSREIISHWSLKTFAENTLKCARIACEHRNSLVRGI